MMPASAGMLGAGLRLAPGRPYAERADPEQGWADRAAAALLGAARVCWPGGTGFRGIVASTARHEPHVRLHSDAELARSAGAMRARLRREGLTREAVGACFALIREAARRTLGRRHFDTQVMAGWALLHGNLVEMATGEGKSVAATLAAATVALAGLPVHVVTVNDYLAERDATELAPLYRFLGLTCGFVAQGMEPPARRAAYGCAITYCSNKELAFDYLRDRLALRRRGSRLHRALERLHSPDDGSEELVLRGLHFAIVDEADSIFIDEARTPLILSAVTGSEAENATLAQALEIARTLDPVADYIVSVAGHSVVLTPQGQARLAELGGGEGVWAFARAREELVGKALTALHLLRRDHDYVVAQDMVQIVDVSTGRVMDGRAWESGLHQLVELKEGCTLTGRRETLAKLTYQRLFRRFVRLAGMTGTGREVASEIRSVYGLGVVRVPLHRPSRRRKGIVRVCATREDKWNAVALRVAEVAREAGRPVLVGTRSVSASEEVSAALAAHGIAHALLNAKQDRDEAGIIARAGEPGRVTVATNMAGRGTDIRLGDGVSAQGGLHVILTEHHDTRRIDRQLVGRCARQGDPGSHDTIISWQDEVFAVHAPRLAAIVARLRAAGLPLPGLRAVLTHVAQSAAERAGRGMRAGSLRQDERLDRFLSFAGRPE